MFAPLMTVDRRNPVNRRHRLNVGRQAWLLSLPNWAGGGRAHDLMRRWPAALTNMTGAGAATNGWRPTSRPAGSSDILFDGSTGYLDWGNSSAVNPSGPQAMGCWFNTSATSGDRWLIARDDDTLGRAFAFGIQGAQLSLQVGGTEFVGSLGPTIATGRWYRALAVFSGTAWSTYLDGAKLGSIADPVSPSATSSTTIGRRTYAGFAGSFAGRIDDASFWAANPLVMANPDAFAWLDYRTSRLGYPGALNRSPFALCRYGLVPPTFRPYFVGRSMPVVGSGVY